MPQPTTNKLANFIAACPKCGVERFVQYCRRFRMYKSCHNKDIAYARRRGHSKIYNIWYKMLQRCGHIKGCDERALKYYAGRGITVCLEWQTCESFYKWAIENGYIKGLTIERKNPDLDYCPANCEWITHSENTRRVRKPYSVFAKGC